MIISFVRLKRERELNNARENMRSRKNDSNSIIVIVTVCSIVSIVFFFSPVQKTIVHSFLAGITSNASRIHDVNDVFSQIRLPWSILPSFISSSRYIACFVLITT